MILGVGVDVCDVRRLRRAMERRGFRERVFDEDEIRDCEARARQAPHYAARFAAKEACFKALGTGWGGGVAWKDVIVRRDGGGPPRLDLRDGAARAAAGLGVARAHLSLSHEGDYAVAMVVLEGRARAADRPARRRTAARRATRR
ncbi:MAG: holo-ACP synthase [Candidatus Polarisedimenticolia bacterium]